MKIDGVADAFCGVKTIVHVKGDAKIDPKKMLEVLKKNVSSKKVTVKGEFTKDLEVLL